MKTRQRQRVLTVISCLALITAAGIMPMFGPILTSFSRDLGISVEAASVLVAVSQLGYLGAVLVAGNLSDRYGKRTLILIGLALISISLVGIALTRVWFLVVGFQVLLGLGLGAGIGSAVAFISDLNVSARSSALGFSQVATGLGSIGGAAMGGFLIAQGYDWTVPVLILALLNLIVLLLYLPFPFTSSTSGERPDTSWRGVQAIVRSPLIQLLFVINGLTVGIQQVLMTLSAPYFEIDLGVPLALAALAPTIFWVGITLGRAVFSATIERLDKDRVWIVCAGLSSLVLTLILAVHQPIAILALLGLGGAFIGTLVPSAVDRSNRAFPNQTGLATGSIFAAAGAGSFLMTLLAANLSVQSSLGSALWLSAVAMLLNLVLTIIFIRRYDFQSFSARTPVSD